MKLLAADRPAASDEDSRPMRRSFLKILGQPVCETAFRRLLGVGSGRLLTLQTAVRKSQPCPIDGRYVQRTRLNLVSEKVRRKREVVVEFLEKLAQTLSEPMPEVQGPSKDANLPEDMKFRRPRGKRPLPQVSRQVCKLKDVSSMRLLPPGKFSDYLKLLNAELPADGQVTMKTFSSVPMNMKFSICLL